MDNFLPFAGKANHFLLIRSCIGHLHAMLQRPDRKLRQLDRNGPPPAQRLRGMRGEGCGAKNPSAKTA